MEKRCSFALIDPSWQTKILECSWFSNSSFGLTVLIVLYYLEPIWFQKCTVEETKPILVLHKCQRRYQHYQVRRCVLENTSFVCYVQPWWQIWSATKQKKKSICWVNKWMWTLNSELLPADTQVCFLSCYQVQTWAVRLAVLVRPGSPTWPGWGLLSSRLIPLTGRLCLTQQ